MAIILTQRVAIPPDVLINVIDGESGWTTWSGRS